MSKHMTALVGQTPPPNFPVLIKLLKEMVLLKN